MNKFWKISIEISVGDYQHTEEIYFVGAAEHCEAYADNYLKDIWGEGTYWDGFGNAVSENVLGEDRREARYGGAELFENITVGSLKGTLEYKVMFELS